jgi:hypothetical protein
LLRQSSFFEGLTSLEANILELPRLSNEYHTKKYGWDGSRSIIDEVAKEKKNGQLVAKLREVWGWSGKAKLQSVACKRVSEATIW